MASYIVVFLFGAIIGAIFLTFLNLIVDTSKQKREAEERMRKQREARLREMEDGIGRLQSKYDGLSNLVHLKFSSYSDRIDKLENKRRR